MRSWLAIKLLELLRDAVLGFALLLVLLQPLASLIG